LSAFASHASGQDRTGEFAKGSLDSLFGGACTGIGDVDGDGVPDILVGAMDAEFTNGKTGHAFVFSGATLRAGNADQAAASTFLGNVSSQAIRYAPNIVAAAAGSNVVTVNFDQPAVFVDLRITEYSRLRSTSPDGDLVEDAIVPASGSYRATAPLNGGTWLLQLAAFRAQ